MKKIVITLSFLAFLTFSHAQDVRNLRIGLIFSNAMLFPSSDNVDIKSKPSYGFDFGINFDYYFTENYALSTGLFLDMPFIYRKNGISFATDTTFTTTNGDIVPFEKFGNQEKITSMNLNFPLSFKLRTNDIGYFKYFGDIGILNTFRIQSKYTLDDTELQKSRFSKKNIEFTNVNYHTSFYNFSLKVGAGIEWTISDQTALIVGVYFYNGFTDYIKDGDKKSTYMRKLSLRTGILF